MVEQQPSYKSQKPTNSGSRPGYINLAVTYQEPNLTIPPLTDWEKTRSFIFDISVKTIKSNLNTDFYFSSQSGDCFCLFSSEDSENSIYLQQETKNLLKSLNHQQDPSMVRSKFAEFYGKINNLNMVPTRGVFCLTVDRGEKQTMVIANCGSFVYLLSPSSRQPYNLGDRDNPGSFGAGSNPKELFVSSVMIQKGDIILATPDEIDGETQEKITQYLKTNFKKPASNLATTCNQIIRKSTLKETSALVISVRQSSNRPNENAIDRRYVATRRKSQLKDFFPFHKR